METALPVVFLGLNCSGKTALIHSATNNHSEIFPTTMLEINYITSTSRTLLAYDVSGEGPARNDWPLIASMASCVFFVIDCRAKGRFANAKKHLNQFLERNAFMRGKNLCIMLNKSEKDKHPSGVEGDNPPLQPEKDNRPSKEMMIKALETDKLGKLVNKVYIRQTSAFTKEGIDECLEWAIKAHGERQKDEEEQ